MEPISAYVAELGNALCGPRRARSDLLTEARDSLVDAAQAYQSHGFSRLAAQRRAVAEFGTVRDIAPAYQTELALSQGRRTAAMVLLALAPQTFVWDLAARLATPTGDPGPVYAVLDRLVEWLGGVALVGALTALLVCGVGVRLVAPRPRLVQLTGVFCGAIAAFIIATGLTLTALNAAAGVPLLHPTGLPWTVAFVVLPMAFVAFWARGCVATARRAGP